MTFARALNAEVGLSRFGARCNFPLHTSSIFDDEDIFGNGKPTSRRNLPAGVSPKALSGKLPVAEVANDHVIVDPWFKHFDTPKIDRYIEAVHKVVRTSMPCANGRRNRSRHEVFCSRVPPSGNVGDGCARFCRCAATLAGCRGTSRNNARAIAILQAAHRQNAAFCPCAGEVRA